MDIDQLALECSRAALSALMTGRASPQQAASVQVAIADVLRSQVSALQAEVEGLRKDAARYAYARTILNVGFVQLHKPDHDEAYNAQVDEQIDKARDSLSGGDA